MELLGWFRCGLAARGQPGVPHPAGIVPTRRMGVVPSSGEFELQPGRDDEAGGSSAEAIGRLARPLRRGCQGGYCRRFAARHSSPSCLKSLRTDWHGAPRPDGLRRGALSLFFGPKKVAPKTTPARHPVEIVHLGMRPRSFSPRRTQYGPLQFRYDIDNFAHRTMLSRELLD